MAVTTQAAVGGVMSAFDAGPGAPGTPEIPPALAELTAAVDALAARATGLTGWGAVETVVELERQIGRLTAISTTLLSRVEADGLWATGSARSLAGWYATRTGSTYQHGKNRVDLARSLRDDLPQTARALVSGQVSVDQAAVLARVTTTSEPRRRALAGPATACGEGFLLAQAAELSAEQLGLLARNWAAAVDPDADERGYRDACEAEFFTVSPTLDGYHLSGFLATDHGAALATALDALMIPPTAGDTRSTQRRRAGALTDLARLVLDHGMVGGGALVRPHLNVVVDYETLVRTLTTPMPTAGDDAGARRPGPFHLSPVADVERFAVAEIIGAGPVPPSVLARLACDSAVSRIVFGPDSQVIDVGRKERIFSGPRRQAILARDRTCRYPGCHAPPALGEIHHIDHWADGGGTDANRGVLLCWFHHELVHARGIMIDPSPTGGWALTRDGQPLRA